MRKVSKISAGIVGFSVLLGACSADRGVPESLAFQEDAPATVILERPVGNPCAQNEFSIEFDDDVVLSDSGATTVGPFAIALPAGTYDVVVSSWLGAEEIPAETNEQWYFTTDSGYTSPSTRDQSPEMLMNQAFVDQAIDETSVVTLHHSAPGTDVANAVHPLCIGFQGVEETGFANADSVAEGSNPTPESGVLGVAVQVRFDISDTADAAADVEVDEPIEQLALTGPSDLAVSLGLAGGALVLAGSAATVAARRSDDF